jgi:HEAT repeat protein
MLWQVSVGQMSEGDLAATLASLFNAQRAARAAHDKLVDADPALLVPALGRAVAEASKLDDEDEALLRFERLADVLGELPGPGAVDLLIEILGREEPEARQAAGEALSGIAFERFKEVALGVERALARLPRGNPALAELPYLLAEVPEPGVSKLLARFLAHDDPDAVASAIEALVEAGDPAALPLLDPLVGDTRRVQLQDEGGAESDASIGELAAEARSMLSARAGT